MTKRIILALLLTAAIIAAFGLWGWYPFRGLLFLMCIAIAACFAIAGEQVVDKLATIKQMRERREQWGEWNLDTDKLYASRARWEIDHRKDAALSEPTRIRIFCSTRVEQLINNLGALNSRDKARPISDVIRLVSYPDSRLARITHELRFYAALFCLVSGYQLLAPAPQVVLMLPSKKAIDALDLLGHRPLEFLAGLELTIFAVFATRLKGELSNLRQYIK